MSYPANLRGWGPGWPTNRARDQVWIEAARSGVDFQVHHVIAPLLKFLIDEVERRGYLLHVKGDTPDDWSFNSRAIRGTRKPSNHSWGLAIDIDATKYPQGQRRKRPPRWVIDLFEAYGFEWGGTWSYADPMHFEFAGSITEARFLVAALAAGHLTNTPAPLPPTAPPPISPPPAPQEDEDMALYVKRESNGAHYEVVGAHAKLLDVHARDYKNRLHKLFTGKDIPWIRVNESDWPKIMHGCIDVFTGGRLEGTRGAPAPDGY